ncbi:ABC transporter permease [Myxococcota bacterium]|nr:ABC transporter permease [Myxococcota bacterium]
MTGQLAAIALNGFREAVRNRVLYAMLFFAVLLIGFSYAIGNLTLGDHVKVVKDFGLAEISVFGCLIAVMVGIGIIQKEIERKTIYTIASKPVPRWIYVVGRFLGLLLTLAVQVAIMAAAYVATVELAGGSVRPQEFVAIGFIYVEMMVLTAFAVLFSTYSGPVLAILFSLSVFVIGRMSQHLRDLGAASESEGFRRFTGVLYRVLPDLGTFDFKAQAVYGDPLEWPLLLAAAGYGLACTVAVLGVACLVFQVRDFK